MAGGMTKAQEALEKRMGMSIWEIRDKILSLPNAERWAFMREHQISGGIVYLAPSQYPHPPKSTEGKLEGEQITIDEWLGDSIRDKLRRIKG